MFELFEDVVSGYAILIGGFGDFGNCRCPCRGVGEEDFCFFVAEAKALEDVGECFIHVEHCKINFSIAKR